MLTELKPLGKTYAHYYGDIVRRLFLTAAVIMLVTLPYVSSQLSTPLSIIGIVAIGFFAGLMNPISHWPVYVNTAIAGGAVVIFEAYAVNFYQTSSLTGGLFLINQVLAILFLLAFYFSTKTIRAMVLGQ